MQERLFEWTPSPLRGEIRVREGQTFYVDCYNANPVSMQEALDTFTQRFEQQPKLFVLGCMNELGDDSKDLHRRAGSQIQLSAEDGVILCGEQAGALMDGLLGAGADTSAIRIVEQVEDARLQIEAFQGAILLKGSRSYGLETLLPDDETFEERRLAAC